SDAAENLPLLRRRYPVHRLQGRRAAQPLPDREGQDPAPPDHRYLQPAPEDARDGDQARPRPLADQLVTSVAAPWRPSLAARLAGGSTIAGRHAWMRHPPFWRNDAWQCN